jgi:cysteine desulfurase/selenocysteine lyase
MSIRTASPPPPRAAREPSAAGFDVDRLRADFPLLDQRVHGKPLVYFDNAATAQKPRAVLDAVRRYYERDNANVHRGVHQLSERATRAYEDARVKVQRFLNAAEVREIIFTRGTTEAINLVAQTYGRRHVGLGDEIVLTHLEHHSNIVPWQLLCEEKGAALRVVPINDRGELLLDEYEKLLTPRTRLVAVAHVSNSLGTVNPVRRLIELAHKAGVPVLLDGAQAVPHLAVDVRALDCDFYAFSGHKVYGPTGIGVLYGKASLLEAMPPWQGGGDMISSVTFAKTTYNDLPYKFEAGTPNIAGAIGLGAALDYVSAIGLDAIAAHEHALLEYATAQLQALPGIRIVGTAVDKAAVISFLAEDPPVFPLDLGTKLDLEGIAVRTGHHCCQPVMDRFGTSGTARVSFALYNTRAEVDRFVAALRGILAEATERPRPTVRLPLAPRSEPAYPKATAASPEAAAAELADVFDFLDDWTERYQYIIELGQKIPPLPDEFRTEPNRVHGCQSTVFLSARKRPGTADVLEFLADSDADIVRGLIALLERVYSGQKASAVLAFDVDGFWKRLGLSENLSSGRRNGLAGMVQRIRAHAAKLAGAKAGSEPGGTR